MKKELTILSLAIAPALSMAQATAVNPNPMTLTPVMCSLLLDDLRIQLSSGVAGAYNCNVAGSRIAFATCHTSGRVATRTGATVVNPTACNDDPNDTAACATTTSSASGALVASTSTAGGSMVSTFGGTCDAAGSRAVAVIP